MPEDFRERCLLFWFFFPCPFLPLQSEVLGKLVNNNNSEDIINSDYYCLQSAYYMPSTLPKSFDIISNSVLKITERMLSLLYKRKPRYREIKYFVQVHSADNTTSISFQFLLQQITTTLVA